MNETLINSSDSDIKAARKKAAEKPPRLTITYEVRFPHAAYIRVRANGMYVNHRGDLCFMEKKGGYYERENCVAVFRTGSWLSAQEIAAE